MIPIVSHGARYEMYGVGLGFISPFFSQALGLLPLCASVTSRDATLGVHQLSSTSDEDFDFESILPILEPSKVVEVATYFCHDIDLLCYIKAKYGVSSNVVLDVRGAT